MDKTHAASGTHPTFTRHRLPSPADQKPKCGITPAKQHIQPMQFVSTLAASLLLTSIPSPDGTDDSPRADEVGGLASAGSLSPSDWS